ncbi:MAG: GAF domain-containing sensor histidine kinase [Gemmatimonadota bacterium]|nr:GAF domain-containing sensor histidine kinase [Gemmatimonadota bacterium]
MVAQPSHAHSDAARLRRLVEAGILINAERSLEAVLQAVVDAARDVIGARYAALGVVDVTGTELSRFVTSGMSQEQADQIGPPPAGKGILGLLIADPRLLRLADLKAHPKAHGFPANHPPMASFLGVPIRGRKGVLGNLYLTDKEGASEFTEADEAVAVLLAASAAVAVDNAMLFEESQRLLHEVRSVQASRDRFFAMINHEVRNALTAVYGWSDLLLRKLGDHPPRAASEVFESAERALTLLNDMLDLSRLEADRLRPTVRATDARHLVQDAVASLEPIAAQRAVRLHTEGLGDEIACETDPQRVRQILINLLSNAVRHSPAEGTVRVVLRSDDRSLWFDVVDRGPGIAASEQSRIFEAFQRATSDERGTGLGLTLSRQLALLLGGDLRVLSEVGVGSTFTLEIPRSYRRA